MDFTNAALLFRQCHFGGGTFFIHQKVDHIQQVGEGFAGLGFANFLFSINIYLENCLSTQLEVKKTLNNPSK